MTRQLYDILNKLLIENPENRELKSLLNVLDRTAPGIFKVGAPINRYDFSAAQIQVNGLTPALQGRINKHLEAVKNQAPRQRKGKSLMGQIYQWQKEGAFKPAPLNIKKHRAERYQQRLKDKFKENFNMIRWDYREPNSDEEALYFSETINFLNKLELDEDELARELIRLRNSHFEAKRDKYKKKRSNGQPNTTSDGDLQISPQ